VPTVSRRLVEASYEGGNMKQKLAEVPKSYFVLPKMGTFELSHISDFHFSLLLRLTLFESSETTHTGKARVTERV
jgi:hypothetical protein